MGTKYVALNTVHYKDEKGKRQVATAANAKDPGVFTADFGADEFERLRDLGAIRLATKEDLARVSSDSQAKVEAPAEDDSTPADKIVAIKEDGKWVAKRGGAVVSGDLTFTSKAKTEAWIAENPNGVTPAEGEGDDTGGDSGEGSGDEGEGDDTGGDSGEGSGDEGEGDDTGGENELLG